MWNFSFEEGKTEFPNGLKEEGQLGTIAARKKNSVKEKANQYFSLFINRYVIHVLTIFRDQN